MNRVQKKPLHAVGSEKHIRTIDHSSNSEREAQTEETSNLNIGHENYQVSNESVQAPTDEQKQRTEETTTHSAGRSTTKAIVSTVLFGFVIFSLIGGSYFALTNGFSLRNFITKDNVNVSAVPRENSLVKLRVDIERLNEQVGSLVGAQSEIAQLRAEKELMNKKLDNIRAQLKREIEQFHAHTKERDSQISTLKNELRNIVAGVQSTTDERLKEIESSIKKIENDQRVELNSFERKLEKFQEDEASIKTAPEVVQETTSASNKQTVSNDRKALAKLGFLSLDKISSIGTHNIAMFTDGISGAIQVSAGDTLGSYRITKITQTQVYVTDSIGIDYVLTVGSM